MAGAYAQYAQRGAVFCSRVELWRFRGLLTATPGYCSSHSEHSVPNQKEIFVAISPVRDEVLNHSKGGTPEPVQATLFPGTGRYRLRLDIKAEPTIKFDARSDCMKGYGASLSD